MKIPQSLPQFDDKPTFILVTGKQHGIAYKVANGEITKIVEEYRETPTYSDNEGHFRTGGRGSQLIGDYVKDAKQGVEEHVIKEFVNEFSKEVHKVEKDQELEEILLFVPDYMKNRLKEAFPSHLQKKVTSVFEGNYTKLSETELLKIIQKEQENNVPVKPDSLEVQKILHKGE